MTFIEILNESCLSTFKAVASFWSLNRDPNTVIEKYGTPGHFLVNAGFPQANYKTIITKETIHHNIKFMSFTNSIDEHKVEVEPPWDFINSTCNYEFAESVPESFKGVSGGGIWSVRVKYKKDLDEYSVLDYCLIGLSYWETGIQNNKQDIRGHFISSIYKSVWCKMRQSTEDS